MKNMNTDKLTGNIVPVFFYYSIPWILGLVMMSSATIVDGIFLGNYVGAEALAAVNLILPVQALVFAFSLMLIVGGSVMCGKYMGENLKQAANAIFTKTILGVFGVAALFGILGIVFLDEIVLLMGANDELADMSATYLFIMCFFNFFFMGDVCLSYFVRLDGRPIFTSVTMISNALLNIALDYIFIVQLKMGIAGAAYATGISHTCNFILFSTHFFTGKHRLRLTRKLGSLRELGLAAYNGLSECTNELSVGLLTLLFNWIMIKRLGVDGVAAFTIINYLLFVGLMISYGIADSLQPLISTNFGARQPDRIKSFVWVASISVFALGVIMASLLLIAPETMIGVFLKEGEAGALSIARQFALLFWPAFLFSGLNIVISSYLTSIQKPLPSAVVSISRSLLFPATFLLLLPMMFGDNGIFVAIPVAELITLCIAFILLMTNRPGKLVINTHTLQNEQLDTHH